MYSAPRLKSLQEIRPEDVRKTQQRPIQILATDFNDYIAKLHKHPNSLVTIKEWLCGHFLKIWALPVPDFAILDIQHYHVPVGLHPDLQPFHFNAPAFGSKLAANALEVTEFYSRPKQYQRDLSSAGGELLRIALFDIWIGNDDRNSGNYNLLYSGDGSPRFIPIDHELTFNGLDFSAPLSLQTENDSFIFSSLFRTYVVLSQRRNAITESPGKDQFLINIAAVEKSLDQIISAAPSEWVRPFGDLTKQLKRTIFAPEWLDKTWNTYVRYISVP